MRWTIIARSACIAALSAVVTACSGDSGTGPGTGAPSLAVAPGDTAFSIGRSAQLSAGERRGDGSIKEIEVRWTSSDPAVLTVSGSGVVQGVREGVATVRAESGGRWGEARVRVLGTRDLGVALEQACAVRSDGAVYCWGDLKRVPERVVASVPFASVAVDNNHVCALTEVGAAYCWTSGPFGRQGTPLAIPGGHAFRAVAVTHGTGCGLRSDGRVLCWQLETGGDRNPVEAPGGHTFVQITSNYHETCGITTGNAVVCWDERSSRLFSEGSFADVRGMIGTFCAVTATGEAFCTDIRDGVKQQAAGHRFKRVAPSGYGSFCGLEESGRAMCWGANTSGQLGIGSTASISEVVPPTPVVGDLRFATIQPAGGHTCGLASDKRAYCWGDNRGGELGDSTLVNRSVPAPVRMP